MVGLDWSDRDRRTKALKSKTAFRLPGIFESKASRELEAERTHVREHCNSRDNAAIGHARQPIIRFYFFQNDG